MNSLVSVIIPYYNKKNYFFESINSALNQTHTNLEIIIIYDDQNRNDLEFIKSCVKNDLRVTIIFNDLNPDNNNSSITFTVIEFPINIFIL